MSSTITLLQMCFRFTTHINHPIPSILLAAFLSIGLFTPLYAAVPAAPLAVTIPVTVTSDSDLAAADDGICTLREAVDSANTGASNDCIDGTNAAQDTIAINTTGVITLTFGELEVDESLIITAPGAASLKVSANFTERVIHSIAPLTLNGFTVADGNASDNGGGVWVELADLVLTNMRFVNNRSTSDGGGVSVDGDVTVTDSEFSNNLSELDGGGLHATGTLTATQVLFSSNVVSLSGGGASIGIAKLNTVTFQDNIAEEFGGGLDVFDRSAPSAIVSSIFQNNTSYATDVLNGGGGGAFIDSDLTIATTRFEDNRSNSDGGALYVTGDAMLTASDFLNNRSLEASGGAVYVNGALNLSGGQMLGNITANGGNGGAVRVNGAANILGGVFRNNSADGFGGAVDIFGALEMSGTQLMSNTAHSDGGGLHVWNSAKLNNVQFIANKTNDDGGGLASSGTLTAPTKIVNSLFARNSADDEGHALDFRAQGLVEVIHTTIATIVPADEAAMFVLTSTVAVTNSIFSGYPIGIKQQSGRVFEDYNLFDVPMPVTGVVTSGLHSLVGLPHFLDPANNNYHLTTASAAIEAGVDVGVTNDFDGETRPQANGFDIGYDEAPFTLPAMTLAAATLAEGNNGVTPLNFTVSISNVRGISTTFYYTTADGSALAGSDYISVANGLAVIPAGQLSTTIAINLLADNIVELDEAFTLQIDGARFATITANSAIGTIINDDNTALSIGDASVAEGNNGTTNLIFSVVLSQPTTSQVTFKYATSNGSAQAGSDYISASGTITLAPLQISVPISVIVNGDTIVEANETLLLTLSEVLGVVVADSSAQGTILNDDGATLSINDVAVTEGNSGTINAVFTLALSQPSPQLVTVDYNTTDGTTLAGEDYIAVTGTVSFAPQQTTAVITVPVKGDTLIEPNETFAVILSNLSGNATIFDGTGLGTIRNDDGIVFAVNDVSAPEGNSGTSTLVFTVTLSQASPQTATVDYTTNNDTAIAGSDYVTKSGTLIFAPLQTSQTISITINGDTTPEFDERFALKLSNPVLAIIGDDTGIGTIINDDSVLRRTLLPIIRNN